MKVIISTEDNSNAESISEYIEKAGYDVDVLPSDGNLNSAIKALPYDVVICDAEQYSPDVLECFHRDNNNNETAVLFILLTDKNGFEDNISAVGSCIRDVLVTPVPPEKLLLVLAEIWNETSGQGEITVDEWRHDLLGRSNNILIDELTLPVNRTTWIHNNTVGIFSEQMIAIYTKLRKLENYPEIPVLLEGETGTGKEVMARNIHLMSSSGRENPFIALNCSLFTNELFNAELFGYEKGSFTGADRSGKEGKIGLAKGGTLFLDEISETTPDFQAKLLRLLQESEYYSVGGLAAKKIQCRVICSTNRPVNQMLEQNLFRQDLYFRLSTCHITIPPLRERRDDILPLVVFLIKKLIAEFNLKNAAVEKEAFSLMESHLWPGNIREMENFIKKNLLFNKTPGIKAGDIRDYIRQNKSRNGDAVLDPDNFIIPDYPFNLNRFNLEIVRKVLDKFSGNKTIAAKHLGLSRSQLYDRFKV